MLGRRIVRVCNIVITLLRIHNPALDFANSVDRFVPSDLQRQQLGVDTTPEDALVLVTLAHPFCHASDTANVLSDLRDFFLPSAMMRLL
jgi:hypothetical protein